MAGSKNSGRGVAMPYYQKNTLDRIEKMFWRLQTSYYRQIADLEVTAYVTKEPVPYAERFSGEEKKLENCSTVHGFILPGSSRRDMIRRTAA